MSAFESLEARLGYIQPDGAAASVGTMTFHGAFSVLRREAATLFDQQSHFQVTEAMRAMAAVAEADRHLCLGQLCDEAATDGPGMVAATYVLIFFLKSEKFDLWAGALTHALSEALLTTDVASPVDAGGKPSLPSSSIAREKRLLALLVLVGSVLQRWLPLAVIHPDTVRFATFLLAQVAPWLVQRLKKFCDERDLRKPRGVPTGAPETAGPSVPFLELTCAHTLMSLYAAVYEGLRRVAQTPPAFGQYIGLEGDAFAWRHHGTLLTAVDLCGRVLLASRETSETPTPAATAWFGRAGPLLIHHVFEPLFEERACLRTGAHRAAADKSTATAAAAGLVEGLCVGTAAVAKAAIASIEQVLAEATNGRLAEAASRHNLLAHFWTELGAVLARTLPRQEPSHSSTATTPAPESGSSLAGTEARRQLGTALAAVFMTTAIADRAGSDLLPCDRRATAVRHNAGSLMLRSSGEESALSTVEGGQSARPTEKQPSPTDLDDPSTFVESARAVANEAAMQLEALYKAAQRALHEPANDASGRGTCQVDIPVVGMTLSALHFSLEVLWALDESTFTSRSRRRGTRLLQSADVERYVLPLLQLMTMMVSRPAGTTLPSWAQDFSRALTKSVIPQAEPSSLPSSRPAPALFSRVVGLFLSRFPHVIGEAVVRLLVTAPLTGALAFLKSFAANVLTSALSAADDVSSCVHIASMLTDALLPIAVQWRGDGAASVPNPIAKVLEAMPLLPAVVACVAERRNTIDGVQEISSEIICGPDSHLAWMRVLGELRGAPFLEVLMQVLLRKDAPLVPKDEDAGGSAAPAGVGPLVESAGPRTIAFTTPGDISAVAAQTIESVSVSVDGGLSLDDAAPSDVATVLAATTEGTLEWTLWESDSEDPTLVTTAPSHATRHGRCVALSQLFAGLAQAHLSLSSGPPHTQTGVSDTQRHLLACMRLFQRRCEEDSLLLAACVAVVLEALNAAAVATATATGAASHAAPCIGLLLLLRNVSHESLSRCAGAHTREAEALDASQSEPAPQRLATWLFQALVSPPVHCSEVVDGETEKAFRQLAAETLSALSPGWWAPDAARWIATIIAQTAPTAAQENRFDGLRTNAPLLLNILRAVCVAISRRDLRPAAPAPPSPPKAHQKGSRKNTHADSSGSAIAAAFFEIGTEKSLRRLFYLLHAHPRCLESPDIVESGAGAGVPVPTLLSAIRDTLCLCAVTAAFSEITDNTGSSGRVPAAWTDFIPQWDPAWQKHFLFFASQVGARPAGHDKYRRLLVLWGRCALPRWAERMRAEVRDINTKQPLSLDRCPQEDYRIGGLHDSQEGRDTPPPPASSFCLCAVPATAEALASFFVQVSKANVTAAIGDALGSREAWGRITTDLQQVYTTLLSLPQLERTFQATCEALLLALQASSVM